MTRPSLVGSCLTFAFAAIGCAATQPSGRAHQVDAPPIRTIEISATKHGFEPNQVSVRVGEVVSLRFTRTVERTCAREVIVSLDGGRKLTRKLPVGTPVSIDLRFDRSGELGYSCEMSMMGGSIVVQP